MVKSQDLDVSKTANDISTAPLSRMDTASYKFLIAKVQEALASNATGELQDTSFTRLLKDCGTCISQSLYIVRELLSEAEVCTSTLTEYLSDAVCLLELLNNFIQTTIESDLTTCCSTKTFPTLVGAVIVTIFSHCKESEPLYGSNLSHVENLLKDLFKNCHQLQLTYLMVLETHFVFDVNNVEDKGVLLEAMEINLRIGEVVESLDPKTMALQWKAMITIYEKYSPILADTSIFQDCITVLCSLIRSNIKAAVEANQDDKVRRSLKIGSFLLKTFLKLCDVFGATGKEYNNVIDLLFCINESGVHLQLTAERSQFINLIENPSECLLKKLLYNETFGNSLLNCDIAKVKREGNFLGLVLTTISVMDCLTQGYKYETVTKSKVISLLYKILSQCRSRELDVTLPEQKSPGLLEVVVAHALALALTLTCEEYCLLERHMVEAILATRHVSALFSSNIWALLHSARDINPQLLFNQIVWLCTMYKKLEKHSMFHRSPQKVHLTYTINRLFGLMEDDDKIRICKQFRIHDDDNLSLWAALGVKNLPLDAKSAAEVVIAEKLKTQLQRFNGSKGPEEMDKLTKVLSVAATCTFARGSGMGDYVVKAWSKTCSKHQFTIEQVTGSWFYDYLQALIALTDAMWHQLCLKHVHLIRLLQYVTSLIQQCSVEFKLLFIHILCKIATTDICEKRLNDFTQAFTCLYQAEDIVRNKMFITLKRFSHKNIDLIFANVEDEFRYRWSNIKDGQDFIDEKDLNDVDLKYVHRCLERKVFNSQSSSVVSELRKEMSGNFDFADNVDNLFGNDSDLEESACKKVKLDSSEAEAVIKRLESDSALLRTMKENVSSAESISRIRDVCDTLNSIIN